MKTIFALFLLLVLAAGMRAAEPASPSRKAELFYSALRRDDLEEISRMLHPRSLSGHREYTEISLAKLRDRYGAEAVEAMLGKSQAGLRELNDLDFFLFSVRVAREIKEVSPAPKEESFRVMGEIVDGPMVYTLTAFDSSYADGGQSMGIRKSESLGFLKDGDEWKINSFPFASMATRAYTDELIKAARSVK